MVICKSPLTDAVTCSNSGGHWGPELKFAGYDLLLLEGKAPNPVYLWIDERQSRGPRRRRLLGQEHRRDRRRLRAETGVLGARISCIGPAGENLIRVACIMNDKSPRRRPLRRRRRHGLEEPQGDRRPRHRRHPVADPPEFGRLVFEAMKHDQRLAHDLVGPDAASAPPRPSASPTPSASADEQLPDGPVRARRGHLRRDDRHDRARPTRPASPAPSAAPASPRSSPAASTAAAAKAPSTRRSSASAATAASANSTPSSTRTTSATSTPSTRSPPAAPSPPRWS